MKGNYSAATLRNRLKRLEGAGMRRTRCTPSFRREDELRARIEALRAQLREAEAEAR